MTQKLFSVAGHPIDGFCLDEKFYGRVVDRAEEQASAIIPQDPDTVIVVNALISASIAEFMQTFEVKKH